MRTHIVDEHENKLLRMMCDLGVGVYFNMAVIDLSESTIFVFGDETFKCKVSYYNKINYGK